MIGWIVTHKNLHLIGMIVNVHYIETHSYFVEIKWFGRNAPETNWFDIAAIDVLSRGGGAL